MAASLELENAMRRWGEIDREICEGRMEATLPCPGVYIGGNCLLAGK
jgi:hypothetical protein